MQLVLASNSPRRRALLSDMGIVFLVDVADIDETALEGEAAPDMVMRLSRLKAEAVSGRHPDDLVLAADTTVVLDGTILGKPADPSEAASMLRSLRGRTHQVYTAVSLAGSDGSSRLSRNDVTMRRYSDAEIEAYVATGDPLDKAGAYAIQHPQFSPVERFTGCFSSIMGLPLGVTLGLLAQSGWPVDGHALATCARIDGQGCCPETARRGIEGSR